MIVVDASVVVDALVVAGPAGAAARRVLAAQAVLDVPAVLPGEVVSAVRSLLLRGAVSAGVADAAVRSVRTLRMEEHAFGAFAARVWALRANVTVYDAWYVALAEALDATLVTADRRLVGATGPRCEIVDVRAFAAER